MAVRWKRAGFAEVFMPRSHGSFVWHELMTSDIDAAQAFYEKAVGWTGKSAGMTGMDYRIFSAGETMVAGLMSIPEEAAKMGVPPNWTGYVGVADVDASTAKIKALGGKVYKEPTDIPGVGRFSVVADPQGAVLRPPEGGHVMRQSEPTGCARSASSSSTLSTMSTNPSPVLAIQLTPCTSTSDRGAPAAWV